MDTAPWPQEFGLMKPSPSSSIEEMLLVSSSTPTPIPCTTRPIPQMVERRGRPQKAQAHSCPRCNSTNTKFCYYNNYSLTQPRYFCKTCKRYWTQGGSLRNIPIGGGSRKNKRSFATSTSHTNSTITTTSLHGSSTSLKKFPDLATTHVMNPNLSDGQDLNSSFYGENKNFRYPTSTSAMELLSGMSARGLAPFIPLPFSGALYPTNGLFGVQNIRPTNPLGFPMDGSGVYGNMHGGVQEGGGRVVLPFENQTQVSQDLEQNRGQGGGSSSGLWSGGIRGGTAW